jgi:hypothetical protein
MELEHMAESAQGQIQTEQQLFEKLLLGLQTFSLNRLQRQGRKAKGYEDLEPIKSQAKWSFQTSKLVSGLRCLIIGEMEDLASGLRLTVHLEETSAVFRLNIASESLPKKGINEGNLLVIVNKLVLSKLYFHASNSTLRLNFDPAYGKQWLQLIIHLKGSPYAYSCIRLIESEEALTLTMRELMISASDLTLKVPLESVGLTQRLEKLDEFGMERLNKDIGGRLSLMQGEHGEIRLEWDVNQWQLDHGLYKSQVSTQQTPITSLSPHLHIKQKYQEFSIPVHSQALDLRSHHLTVSMHFSTIAETYRLQVVEGQWECTFYEEEFRQEFAFVKSLQFHSLQLQPVTLFRSVEFQALLLRLLNV